MASNAHCKVDTFSQFGILPHDVRVIIWELAVVHPRLIYVQARPRKKRHYSDNVFSAEPIKHEDSWEMYAYPYIPPLLAVCRESYNTLRKHYDLAFSTDPGRSILFNFDFDKLVIIYDDFVSNLQQGTSSPITMYMNNINERDRNRLRHLVFQESAYTGEPDRHVRITGQKLPKAIDCIQIFPRLLSLGLLLPHEMSPISPTTEDLATIDAFDLKATTKSYEQYLADRSAESKPSRILLKSNEPESSFGRQVSIKSSLRRNGSVSIKRFISFMLRGRGECIL